MLPRPLSLLLLLLLLLIASQSACALENPFARWITDNDGGDERMLEESAVDPRDLEEMDPQQYPLDEQAEHHDDEEEDEPELSGQDEFGDEAAERAAFMTQFAVDPLVEVSDDVADHQRDDDDELHPEDHSLDRKLSEAAAAATPTPEEDDPDEFAALADIDLSPFHMHFADKAVLTRLVDWAYDRTAHRSRFHDGFVHADELGGLFRLTLNPTGAHVPPEYDELLEAAAADMRATQGLVEGETPVPRGFVSRGMPLRALQEVAQQMHELHSEYRRRLEEL